MIKRSLELSTFAMPLIASMFIQMFANVFCMFMVARLGTHELAAGALAVNTHITLYMVLMIFYAVGILVSHLRGQEKNYSAVGVVVKNAFWLGLILAIPLSILLWNADLILMLFRQDPSLVHITRGYFHFDAFVMPVSFISMIITQFFVGIGKPKYSLFISILIFPLSLIFSYVLILGKFGFPLLGLAGVTAANLLVQGVGSLVLLIYLAVSKEMRKYSIFSGKLSPDFSIIKQILVLGYPIGMQFGAELSAMTLATYFMGYFGVIPLAAAQIVSQYIFLVVMIILGLSQAVTMLSSVAYGKNDIALVREYVSSSIFLFSIVMLGIGLVFILFPHQLILFFGGKAVAGNVELIHLATVFFAIAAVMLYADAIRNFISGALRGMQDSKVPMQVGVVCLWLISIPLGYLLGFYYPGGPIPLRIGFSLGIAISAVVLFKRYNDRIKLLLQEQGYLP